MVADDPDNKIELKTFHCEIITDHDALKQEQRYYKQIPIIRTLENSVAQRNYTQIKQDVQEIVQAEMEKLLNDPLMTHLIIRKG